MIKETELILGSIVYDKPTFFKDNLVGRPRELADLPIETYETDFEDCHIDMDENGRPLVQCLILHEEDSEGNFSTPVFDID